MLLEFAIYVTGKQLITINKQYHNNKDNNKLKHWKI